MGSSLADLSIHYPERRLYVANFGYTPTYVIDLETQQPLSPLQLGTGVFKINAGRQGRVYYEEQDQWVFVRTIDTLTGTEIGNVMMREGDAEIDPTGTFYYHCDSNTSSAQITKYRITQDTFEPVSASPAYNSGSRNLILSGDGRRLFWRGYVYDSDLTEIGNLGEEILATTLRGELAFSAQKIFNSVNGQVLFTLPFNSDVLAVAGDQQKVFAFDSAAKQLRVIPMRQIAAVPGLDLVPTPADGGAVSLPFSQLSWTTSPFAVRHEVFLGTNATEVAAAGAQSAFSLGETEQNQIPAPRNLQPGAQYYWRVDVIGMVSRVVGSGSVLSIGNFLGLPLGALVPLKQMIQLRLGAHVQPSCNPFQGHGRFLAQHTVRKYPEPLPSTTWAL